MKTFIEKLSRIVSTDRVIEVDSFSVALYASYTITRAFCSARRVRIDCRYVGFARFVVITVFYRFDGAAAAVVVRQMF